MTEFQLDVPRIDPELPPSSDPFGEVLQLLQLTGVLYCNAQLSDSLGYRTAAAAWCDERGSGDIRALLDRARGGNTGIHATGESCTDSPG